MLFKVLDSLHLSHSKLLNSLLHFEVLIALLPGVASLASGGGLEISEEGEAVLELVEMQMRPEMAVLA